MGKAAGGEKAERELASDLLQHARNADSNNFLTDALKTIQFAISNHCNQLVTYHTTQP